MSLLNAPPYDDTKDTRRNKIIIITLVVLLTVAALAWHFRYVRQERIVNHFFAAIEQGDFAAAYGIYYNDPEWKQHQDKYANYPLNEFIRDWGPASEYGKIATHKIVAAHAAPKLSGSSGNGVIVQVSVNGRPVPIPMWVQDSTHTVTVFPYDLQ